MFVRHVFQLGVANVAAQLLSLLAVPVLTRLYSPTDYGAFAIYLALLNMVVPIASLRYHAALVLPRMEAEKYGLFIVALRVIGLMSVGLLILVLIVHLLDLAPPEWEAIGATSLFWLLPLNVAAMGILQLASAWLMAQQQFQPTAKGRIIESLLDRLVSGLLGLIVRTQQFGLACGRLLGSGLAALYLFRKASLRSEKAMGSPEGRTVSALAAHYRHFALVSSWASLCDGAARQSPALILALCFSPVIAGYYMLAFQVVNVPIMIAGDALASTFFQRAAAARDKPQKLAQDSLRLFQAMLSAIIPVTLLLVFLGLPAFRIVFGPAWEPAGRYAELLALGFLFMFLHRPLSVLFDVHEAQAARLWFDGTNLVLRTGVMMGLALLSFGPEAVLIGFTVMSAILYGSGLFFLLYKVGIPIQRSILTFLQQLVLFTPLGSALWITAHFLQSTPSKVTAAAVALGLQGILVFRFERQTLHTMWPTKFSNPSAR